MNLLIMTSNLHFKVKTTELILMTVDQQIFLKKTKKHMTDSEICQEIKSK